MQTRNHGNMIIGNMTAAILLSSGQCVLNENMVKLNKRLNLNLLT